MLLQARTPERREAERPIPRELSLRPRCGCRGRGSVQSGVLYGCARSSRRLHSTASLVRAPAPGARTQRRQAARRAQPQARRIAERAPRRSAAPRPALGASYRTPIIRSSAPSVACGSRLSGRRPPATPRLLSGGTRSATSASWWRRSCRPRRRAPARRPGCGSTGAGVRTRRKSRRPGGGLWLAGDAMVWGSGYRNDPIARSQVVLSS